MITHKKKTPNAKNKPKHEAVVLKSKAPPRPRKRQLKGGVIPQMMLSPCAEHYAVAIANPWSSRALGACIPRHPSRPSHKVNLFTRYNIPFTYNSVNPNCLLIYFTPSLTSDAPVAWYCNSYPATKLTNSSGYPYGGVSYTSPINGSGVWGSSSINNGGSVIPNTGAFTPIYATCPYTTNQFSENTSGGTSLQGRLVAAGIKMQYYGTSQNMGGGYFMYQTDAHDNVNAYDPLSISGYRSTKVERETGKAIMGVLSSLDDSEIDYNYGPISTAVNPAVVTDTVYPYSSGYTLSPSLTTYIASVTIASCVIGSTFPGTANSFAFVTVPNSASSIYFGAVVTGTSIAAGGTWTVYSIEKPDQTSTGTASYVWLCNTSATTSVITAGASVSLTFTNPAQTSSNTPPCIYGGAPMMIVATPLATCNYELEICMHAEYIGKPAQSMLTPSHADTVGLETVMSASARTSVAITSNSKSWPQNFAMQLKEAMHSATVVGSTIGTAMRAAGRYMKPGGFGLALEDAGSYLTSSGEVPDLSARFSR